MRTISEPARRSLRAFEMLLEPLLALPESANPDAAIGQIAEGLADQAVLFLSPTGGPQAGLSDEAAVLATVQAYRRLREHCGLDTAAVARWEQALQAFFTVRSIRPE